MPTWFIAVNVAAVIVTAVVALGLFLRSKGAVVTLPSVLPAPAPHSPDRAATLAEVGKALDLVDDLVAAGKTKDEAKALLMPAVEAILFGGQKPAEVKA